VRESEWEHTGFGALPALSAEQVLLYY
jgi:hypothetical protein